MKRIPIKCLSFKSFPRKSNINFIWLWTTYKHSQPWSWQIGESRPMNSILDNLSFPFCHLVNFYIANLLQNANDLSAFVTNNDFVNGTMQRRCNNTGSHWKVNVRRRFLVYLQLFERLPMCYFVIYYLIAAVLSIVLILRSQNCDLMKWFLIRKLYSWFHKLWLFNRLSSLYCDNLIKVNCNVLRFNVLKF